MFTFDADTSLADVGVWREFQGGRFLIAHISNTKFQRALARLQQPHRRKIEKGELDPKVGKEILCRALAEGILLGWQGVNGSDGTKDVPYSPEAGLTALTKNPEFRDFVSEVAANIAEFRREELEDLGKD